MSTFYDHHFRFEGDASALAGAREEVERLRKKNKRWSGNGSCDYNAPARDFPGGFDWFFFSCDGEDKFRRRIRKLTGTAGLRALHCLTSTDGQCVCDLWELAGGEKRLLLGLDDAAPGMDAALAYERAERGAADGADLDALLARFDLAVSDGWEEFDQSWLLTAGACVRAAFRIVGRLAPEPAAWERIVGMEKALREVRADLADLAGLDATGLVEIDGLLTLIDERKLAAAAPTKAGKAPRGKGGATKGKGRADPSSASETSTGERSPSGRTTL